jgi:DNA-binding IclR family transcriptional regulator
MTDAYQCASQQRILKVMLCLAGHEVLGLAPGEIAEKVQSSPSVTTRDLRNLQAAGIAERIEETGRWRLGPRVPQIAVAMLNSLDRATSKLDEVRQRYTRAPR